MADIELVINITKHEWEYLNKLVENGDQLGHYERLLVNGTPLPKGHGRLIDISEYENYFNTAITYDDGNHIHSVYTNMISTIVEAESEDKE